jgi:hypothetical protein
MSDLIELVRAANPVPRPEPFDADVRQRMKASILADHLAGAGDGARRGFGRALHRIPRLRLFIIVGGVLVAGGTAAALGVLGGQPSAPPTGTLPGSRVDANAATGYSISVTPNLDAGSVGWCLSDRTYFKQGGAGSLGCAHAPLPGRPIVALGGSENVSKNRSGVTSTTTSLVYLTTSQAAAVRVSPTLTILTRADAQLPAGYRLAIDIHQTITHGRAKPPVFPSGQKAVALNAAGQPFGLPPTTFPFVPPHDRSVFWQPGRTKGVGPQPKLHKPPVGACEIDTGNLAGVKLFFGWVVEHVHGFPDLAGKSYLSCANTQFGYGGEGVIAAILLDAQHPGTAPEPLPDAKPVPGHPQTYNEPAIPAPAGTTGARLGNPAINPAITARRVGDAWLVVQATGTLAQRLAVLDRLGACVQLSGAACPAAPA